jgi:hypothetical protein
MTRRRKVAVLRPPVWAAELASGDAALADFHAWRRQRLRAERLGDEVASRRARAAVEERRDAAVAAVPPRLRRAWQAIEYTEECLVRSAAPDGDDDGHHDPSLCYLCDPAATLALSTPLAVGYATAAMFQVENGDEADGEFLDDWNELRRAHGVRAFEPEGLRHSAEARDDLRAFLATEVDDVCLAHPVEHLRRTGHELTRADVDAIVQRVLVEAERYWLAGNTRLKGLTSTRLKTPFTT